MKRTKKGRLYRIFILSMLLSIGFSTLASARVKKTVKISSKSVTINVGSKKTIKLNHAKGKIRYSLNNPKVAAVNQSKNAFTISGRKAGKATLKVIYKKQRYTCKITVNAKKKAHSKQKNTGNIPKDEGMHSARMYTYSDCADIDYMTEVYLQRAGVKPSQSDDQIVQRIYTFLAKNWLYPYEGGYFRGSQIKSFYYDDPMLDVYEQTTHARKDAGEITLNSKYALGEMTDLETGEVVGTVNFMSDAMLRLVGVCDENSAAFTIMCNHAGIVAGKAGGSVDGVSHAWSWAIVNGKKYYYDPGFAIHTYHSTKKVDYSRYKMKRSAMKKNPKYIFTEEY